MIQDRDRADLLQTLDAPALLDVWGARSNGGSLKEARGIGYPEARVPRPSEIDYDLCACWYVENTGSRPGEDLEHGSAFFRRHRAVLVHLHVAKRPLTSFAYQQPGMSLRESAIFHGQRAAWERVSKDPARLGWMLYNRFLVELARRLKDDPLLIPDLASMDAGQIARLSSRFVDRRFIKRNSWEAHSLRSMAPHGFAEQPPRPRRKTG